MRSLHAECSIIASQQMDCRNEGCGNCGITLLRLGTNTMVSVQEPSPNPSPKNYMKNLPNPNPIPTLTSLQLVTLILTLNIWEASTPHSEHSLNRIVQAALRP